ncbi:MAG: hypothetical protein SGARI_004409, partial [Bacillariaceae sp.]
MVVADELGQYILLQIYGLKNIKATMKSFTPGARFFLRNPFLQIGKDNTPCLRVDQPFDLIRIDFPPLHGEILIVGDGDFSFSASLAQQNHTRGNAKIIATSLDSAEDVKKLYAKGTGNLRRLAADRNVSVYHGVSAADIRKPFYNMLFDSIVWNFPYPKESIKGVASYNLYGPV